MCCNKETNDLNAPNTQTCQNGGDCENCERRFSKPLSDKNVTQTLQKLQGLREALS